MFDEDAQVRPLWPSYRRRFQPIAVQEVLHPIPRRHLEHLRQTPADVFKMWTGKEAVQKCLGKGMHLNPRDIQISIGSNEGEISIENLKIQLEYWTESGYHLSLATAPANPRKLTPEDRLLEETRRAMESQPDWSVGCKTQRSGA